MGVQPEILNDYGGSLRPRVKARIPEAIRLALGILAEWGIEPAPRKHSLSMSEAIGPSALDIDAYELGRPSLRTSPSNRP